MTTVETTDTADAQLGRIDRILYINKSVSMPYNKIDNTTRQQ